MYSRCTLHTPLSAADALQRLSQLVRPRHSFSEAVDAALTWNNTAEAPFVGTITDHRFRIRRPIRYRNSFLPIVFGEVSQQANGSRIDLTLRVSGPVGAFMTLWLAAAFFGAGAGVRHWLQTGDVRALLALFLPLFGCLLILVGFISERRKALNLLAAALETTPENQRISVNDLSRNSLFLLVLLGMVIVD
jgi:hypothetical protein